MNDEQNTEQDNREDAKRPVEQLVMRCRELEIDHEPNGWPAIQMRDITALCDAVDDLLIAAKIFTHLRDDSPGAYDGDVLIGHCASHDTIGRLDCCLGKYT